ncbi:MAG: hypothetical protein P8L68_12735 [Paracoccaceae bacterium]|nr:hypothetical protein [Paracoccaceae bacterium]MDG2259349.1 hypothetical protein [Paracoccaceae bacterium]
MAGDVTPIPDKVSDAFIVGCDPQVHIRIVEDHGNLFVKMTSLDNNGDIGDLDAVFFNFTDPSIVGSIHAWMPDGTGAEFVDDGINSLSDGTELRGDYDARIEFSDTDSGVEGNVDKTCFTLWCDDRPLTIEDFDLESFAMVVDTESSAGNVLTHNADADAQHEMYDFKYGDWHPDGNGGWEFVGGDEVDEDPASRSFTVLGDVNVEVTMLELDNGDMQVDLEVLGDTGQIGDLRGFFFALNDDTLADDIDVVGDDVTRSKFDDDKVDKLGRDVKLPKDIKDFFGKFDGGVEIGSKGLEEGHHDDDDDDDEDGYDDIRFTSFTLSHDSEALTHEDFEGQPVVINIDSVGEEGGDRDDDAVIMGAVSWEEDCDPQYVLGEVEEEEDDVEFIEDADDDDDDGWDFSFWLF